MLLLWTVPDVQRPCAVPSQSPTLSLAVTHSVRPCGRGHGHDLLALAEPRWMWVETFGQCGNGVVEGGEQCDDGSRCGGDGCDVDCQACCWEPDGISLQTTQCSTFSSAAMPCLIALWLH